MSQIRSSHGTLIKKPAVRWTHSLANRRGELLEKELSKTITAEESAELGKLNAKLDVFISQRMAPQIQYAKKLLRQLKAKASAHARKASTAGSRK